MVPFHTVTLFSFDFPLNFLKSLQATHYVARFFSLLGVFREVKRVLAFPKFCGFEPCSSIKLLSAKLKTNVPFKYGAILSRQGMSSPMPR